MRNVILYQPQLKDYWYEAKILNDAHTMSYNKGYLSTNSRYNSKTGCIAFPKEKWEATYNNRQNNQTFFSYILDAHIQQFVGYVGYVLEEEKHMCDVVIEHTYRHQGYGKKALQLLCKQAKHNGIVELYDTFEIEREDALSLFMHEGFQIVEYQKWMKENSLIKGVVIRKKL